MAMVSRHGQTAGGMKVSGRTVKPMAMGHFIILMGTYVRSLNS